jgi:Ca2+-binding RTX toxin-like protein
MMRTSLAAGVAAALCIAPTAALGAAVEESRDADSRVTIEYRAGNGETNDLNVAFAGATVFTDAGATIKSGPGCSTSPDGSATCSAFPELLDVLLRNGDDGAWIQGYPQLQNLHLSGGSGADEMTGIAVWETRVEGDDGDDAITAQADARAIADGGSGNDKVTVVPYLAHGTAVGGSGSDELYFRPAGGQASEVHMDGGNGADLLDAMPAATEGSTLQGGPGNDVINVKNHDVQNGVGFIIRGDAGDDTVFAGPVNDTVEAGAGRDVIDVQGGGSDAVICGDGTDVVRHDASDSVDPDCEVVVTS